MKFASKPARKVWSSPSRGYFLVVRCFVEQINVMVFTIRHDAKMIYSSFINPLTPKSDQHLISPYNITPDLHIKVTRIQEVITN